MFFTKKTICRTGVCNSSLVKEQRQRTSACRKQATQNVNVQKMWEVHVCLEEQRVMRGYKYDLISTHKQ